MNIKFDPTKLSPMAFAFIEIVRERHPGCILGDEIIVGERRDDLSMRISCNSAISWRERCKKYGYAGSMKPSEIERLSGVGGSPIPTDDYLAFEEARIIAKYGELPAAVGFHQATYTGRNLRRIVGLPGEKAIELIAKDFFDFLSEGDLA